MDAEKGCGSATAQSVQTSENLVKDYRKARPAVILLGRGMEELWLRADDIDQTSLKQGIAVSLATIE